MRAVAQRVTRAGVTVGGEAVGRIGAGLLALIGAEDGDTERDAAYLAEKLIGLRVFDDAGGRMNRSVRDAGGAILIVSQFTLLGDVRHGKRPSYDKAARPELAEPLIEGLAERIRAAGVPVETGRFRAEMAVESINDGPVTILLDSRKAF